MHNPSTTTLELAPRDVTPPARSTGEPRNRRFAPLCTRTVEVAIATVEDESGWPLVGVFVPDGELL